MDRTCPGQSQMFWKPGDIFEVNCPECGGKVEFFKDDVARKCKNCGRKIKNPKLDLGCVEWCQYADECMEELGYLPDKKGKEETDPAG